MSDRFLSISQVQMRFERNGIVNPVLKDINLEVNRGEYISLIGHSGCGKSTVLNIITASWPTSTGQACGMRRPTLSAKRMRLPLVIARRAPRSG